MLKWLFGKSEEKQALEIIEMLMHQLVQRCTDNGEYVPHKMADNVVDTTRMLQGRIKRFERPVMLDKQTLKRLRIYEEHMKDFPYTAENGKIFHADLATEIPFDKDLYSWLIYAQRIGGGG